MYSKTTGTYFLSITMVLGQPAGLSKEVCLYAGADWLKVVCQLVMDGESLISLSVSVHFLISFMHMIMSVLHSQVTGR